MKTRSRSRWRTHLGPAESILPEIEPFDLAYLDPPFVSQTDYKTPDGEIAFTDRWPDLDGYLHWLQCVVSQLADRAKPHASIIVHIDPRVSHHVRVRLDALLGERSFRDEIIWRYRRWPSPARRFQRVHDVLLRYVVDTRAEHRWNQLHEPQAASTIRKWGTKKQHHTWIDGTSARNVTQGEESPGTLMGDVWDIGIIAPNANERTDWPTQKPIALLERVILALSNPGDVVIDPCMGSGTTLVAALQNGRRAIGIDKSARAVEIASRRCVEAIRAIEPMHAFR